MIAQNFGEDRKQRRIEQLAHMSQEPEKLAEELEAMSEILYDMEKRERDDHPQHCILAGMMADLAAILSIKYFTLAQARTTQDEESPEGNQDGIS